jgi:hypothetical protein
MLPRKQGVVWDPEVLSFFSFLFFFSLKFRLLYQEDKKLKDLVGKQKGDIKWNKVSEGMGNLRCRKQCRERWYNHVDSSILKDPWTEAEYRIILETKHENVDPKNVYKEIVSSLNVGQPKLRTHFAVKTLWRSSMKKKIHGYLLGDVKRTNTELPQNDGENKSDPDTYYDNLFKRLKLEEHVDIMLRLLTKGASRKSLYTSLDDISNNTVVVEPALSATRNVDASLLDEAIVVDESDAHSPSAERIPDTGEGSVLSFQFVVHYSFFSVDYPCIASDVPEISSALRSNETVSSDKSMPTITDPASGRLRLSVSKQQPVVWTEKEVSEVIVVVMI